jgi:hypothetical protein
MCPAVGSGRWRRVNFFWSLLLLLSTVSFLWLKGGVELLLSGWVVVMVRGMGSAVKWLLLLVLMLAMRSLGKCCGLSKGLKCNGLLCL